MIDKRRCTAIPLIMATRNTADQSTNQKNPPLEKIPITAGVSLRRWQSRMELLLVLLLFL